jgi:exonuclease III
MTGKGREIVEVMERRRVDVLCVQETRWRGNGVKMLANGCKLFYSGGSERKNGVGVILSQQWCGRVLQVTRCSERLLMIKLACEDKITSVISAYAPQVGCEEEMKEKFCNEWEDLVANIRTDERVVVCGDMNAHVGKERADGWEGERGHFGYGVRNKEGDRLLEAAQALGLYIVNTGFCKRDEHLITYASGGRCSQIDYMLVRKGDRKEVLDCKALPNEDLTSQHRLLVATMQWVIEIKIAKRGDKKLRVWKLKEASEEYKKVVRDGREELSGVDAIWENLVRVTVEACEKVVGRTSGRRMVDKETWWWCEEVQEAVRAKKKACREWKIGDDGGQASHDRYRECKRECKRVVAKARREATDEWYKMLDTKQGAKEVYKIARNRLRAKEEIKGIPAIKDDGGNVLMRTTEKLCRWKQYFEQLMNVENERVRDEECERAEGPINEISMNEVVMALRGMKDGKASGPSEVSAEMIKVLKDEGVAWLHKLVNEILMQEKIPDEWRKSILIPIYKKKGNAMECGNYRGIKLIEHCMKVFERIIEARLRQIVCVRDTQYGFMKGKSTIDAIWVVRQLQEKMIERQKGLYCCYVDLEKAYDRIPRDVILGSLRKKGVPERLVRVVEDMYGGARTTVRTDEGSSDQFEVKVGLHQGSALSPFLFVVVMDVVSESVAREELWEMLYADDLCILAESKADMENRVREWQEVLERNGLKVNERKTEVMVCSRKASELVDIVDRSGAQFKQVSRFKYLGSVVCEEGGCEEDVKARVKAAWNKWREMSGIMCDKRMPIQLKAKVYKTVVRPVLMYGSELWALRKAEQQLIERTEMRMLRWMLGVSRMERIRNVEIRKRVGVVNISDKMRECRLRWLGHVVRRDERNQIRRVWELEVDGKRPRGRPKLRWKDVVRKDMSDRKIDVSLANDRILWRAAIRSPDPTSGTRG